ncbi:MAG TPA: phosphatidylserine/phosphatidylglycerophosphate/cardiolipin synthase family protein [Myxococcota bacterium]|nr:phosphatidylserine/phosphatidylglycerophosphate/cardiolipin synthase family protein [Myxococcota bacterium]
MAEDAPTLLPGHFEKLSDEMSAAVLAYLNLPPLGCYADREEPPALGSDLAFEIPAPARLALLSRRESLGGFASPADLIGIPGFGKTDLDALTERLGDLRRYGQRLRPVWGGPEAEAEFFRLLESAEKYIHIQMYIIGGEVGLRMARLLVRKKRQGVKVRILFTASGFVISGSPSGTGFVNRLSRLRSYLYNDRYVRKLIVRELVESGVPLVDSAPIGRHWRRSALRAQGVKNRDAYTKWARERDLPDAWVEQQQRIDKQCALGFSNVDHRKMIVVDGKRAFIGSMNLADSYLYQNELSHDPRVNVRRWQWHDNAAILDGGCIADLNQQFAERWALSGGDFFDHNDSFYTPPPERVGHAAVTIVKSIPGMVSLPMKKNLGRFVLSMLGADLRPQTVGNNPIRRRVQQLPELANNDFYVEHCYPSDAELLAHWTEYAVKLSDFTMVVPLHYDTRLLGLECDRFYPEMIAAGARLQGFNRAIMHSKIAVADGFYVSTGSYNLNLRSARADLEMQFFVQDRSFGEAVRGHIVADLEECQPIKPGPLDRIRSRVSLPLFDAFFRYFFL